MVEWNKLLLLWFTKAMNMWLFDMSYTLCTNDLNLNLAQISVSRKVLNIETLPGKQIKNSLDSKNKSGFINYYYYYYYTLYNMKFAYQRYNWSVLNTAETQIYIINFRGFDLPVFRTTMSQNGQSSSSSSAHNTSSSLSSGGTLSSMETLPTQDVVDGEISEEENKPAVWGRLYPVGRTFRKLGKLKGIFTDSNDIFSWHKLEDIVKKRFNISKISVDFNFYFFPHQWTMHNLS